MRLAPKERRQDTTCNSARILKFRLDPCELLRADTIHLGWREGGIANDIGKKVERKPQIGG